MTGYFKNSQVILTIYMKPKQNWYRFQLREGRWYEQRLDFVEQSTCTLYRPCIGGRPSSNHVHWPAHSLRIYFIVTGPAFPICFCSGCQCHILIQMCFNGSHWLHCSRLLLAWDGISNIGLLPCRASGKYNMPRGGGEGGRFNVYQCIYIYNIYTYWAFGL